MRTRRRSSEQLILDVGHRLRELRLGQEVTQAFLADKLKVTVSYYQRLEAGQGNPSVKALDRLAKALGVDPAALLERPTRRVKAKKGRPKKKLAHPCSACGLR